LKIWLYMKLLSKFKTTRKDSCDSGGDLKTTPLAPRCHTISGSVSCGKVDYAGERND